MRRSRAIASPCIAAMPTRRPVKDPGPAATASSSTASSATPAIASAPHQVLRQARAVRDRAVADELADDARRRARRPRFRPVSWCRVRELTRFGSMLYSRHQVLHHTVSSPVSSEHPGATPAMRQYLDAKRQHRDAIVFFRMGDFYEMFYEDALTASRALELTLTSRAKDATGGAIPMCGVPFHAADGYIARLVRKGYRVAICEQVEDPRKAKGLVRREVTRVVSPGTFTDAGYLEAREPAFLAALAPADRGTGLGVALLDVSTGEFAAAEYDGTGRPPGARRRAGRPASRASSSPPDGFDDVDGARRRGPAGDPRDDGRRLDVRSRARRGASLLEQLQTRSLDGFGLDGSPGGDARRRRHGAVPARHAEGRSRARPRHHAPRQRRRPAHRSRRRCATSTSIEAPDGGAAGSLLDEIDRTVTSMGGRLLRAVAAAAAADARAHPGSARRGRGLRVPLDRARQAARHAARDPRHRAAGRARLARHRRAARPGGARQSLAVVPRVRAAARASCRRRSSRSLVAELDDLADVRDALERTLVDEPPALARDGGVIRDGVDPDLDELRSISRGGKQRIAAMEDAERARTGIASLKIRYNRVFGYYIEISKSNLGSVPADYLRKQTIAGGERFITPALKEYEDKVLGADERIARARGRALRGAARARRGRGAAHPGHGARPGDARRPGRRSPRRRRRRTTPSR